ncbi:MAG: DUF4160 domain-containing protein [Acetobacteraceae bacterium]
MRAHGLWVVIFANDHQRAHVHVLGDGEAKINLRVMLAPQSWSGPTA